jgi:hypothetical protein
VVEHAARRIAAPDVGDASVPSADEVDVASFVDAYVGTMPTRMRGDLMLMLAYLEHVAPVALGLSSRFTHLPPGAQDDVLASLESSPKEMLSAGFAGLKALVFMGYYRDPRTWKIMGYDGPLVKRPLMGWWSP